ncbi:MAG: hypothetical protein ABIG10_03310 [bacterium]
MKNLKQFFNFEVLKTSAKFLISAIIIMSVSFIYIAIAAPPTSEYTPGETLAPTCSPGDTNCTVTSPITANQTITLSGDVSGSGTTAITAVIGAEQVEESMLKAVDTASDEECLTYETTTGDFEWQVCSTATGDVSGVGDCAEGACLDGTSDGGGYIKLYDGDSNYVQLDSSNLSADIIIYLPASVAGAESFLKMGTDGIIDYDTNTYLTAEADTLDTVIGRGATTTTATTFGNITSGANGADGLLTLFSEQGETDYSAALNPHSAMTSAANFYLPADEPGGTYLLNMTAGGVVGYDSSTYLTTVDISANTNLAVSGTLLQKTDDTLNLKEGTLTDTKYCIYDTTNGLVCNSDAGLSYLTESYDATYDTVKLLATHPTDSNVNIALQPKGTGAIQAQLADGTTVGGNARGAYAVDLQMQRTNAAYIAQDDYSVICGGKDNFNQGDYGFIGSGRINYVSGSSAAIVAGYDNDAGGSYSFVGAGMNNSANAAYSAIAAGYYNYIYSGYNTTFIGGGTRNEISQDGNSGTSAAILGGEYGKAYHYASQAHAAGKFSVAGDAQTIQLVARNQTTDATQTELFLNGSSYRATIPSDMSWVAEILVVGRRTDADNETYSGSFAVGIDNNAGITALVGTVTTIHEQKDGTWSVAIDADDTNDALRIQVTGEAAKTIRWVAFIRLVQVDG